ncbi:hypothetical protein TNCT_275661 [Trichonephila clavata]|uniref:Uncharacterized protein n=1 Tax=Trichonephila clavata TaxID=2740835 RepID=A0A8X6FTH5_TRICU|nr:hypothetical protein TNCT_275661 [Trichonephila clavata]
MNAHTFILKRLSNPWGSLKRFESWVCHLISVCRCIFDAFSGYQNCDSPPPSPLFWIPTPASLECFRKRDRVVGAFVTVVLCCGSMDTEMYLFFLLRKMTFIPIG